MVRRKYFATFASMICSLFLFLTIGCSKSEGEVHDIDDVVYSRVDEKIKELDLVMKTEGKKLYDFNVKSYSLRGEFISDADHISSEDDELIRESLGRIVSSTKDVLSIYGIGENELISSFGRSDDERIALVGIAFVDLIERDEFRDLGWDDYVDCAGEALGLNVFTSIRHAGGKITRKAVMSMVKSAAKRAFGPIGAAITIGEFSWCLYRNS